ncbi:MAG: hypothetical protein ACLFNQ_04960 [Spirochaetaceae bacterium]
MNVLVNDERIDVTLEDEHTVGDVVRELAGWLSTQGMELQGVTIDDEAVALQAADSWHETTVTSVDTINVNATLHPARDPKTLQVLLELLTLLERNLEQGTPESVNEALREYQYARPTLARVLGFSSEADTPALVAIDRLAAQANSKASASEHGPEEQHGAHTAARAIIFELRERLAEAENPARQTAATAEALRMQLAQLSDIAVMLQQGRDAEAMKHLLAFTELVEKLIRLGAWSSSDGDELNTYFGELIQAFEAQDTVLIGDLVEYEILPRVETLLDSFEEDAIPE